MSVNYPIKNLNITKVPGYFKRDEELIKYKMCIHRFDFIVSIKEF